MYLFYTSCLSCNYFYHIQAGKCHLSILLIVTRIVQNYCPVFITPFLFTCFISLLLYTLKRLLICSITKQFSVPCLQPCATSYKSLQAVICHFYCISNHTNHQGEWPGKCIPCYFCLFVCLFVFLFFFLFLTGSNSCTFFVKCKPQHSWQVM